MLTIKEKQMEEKIKGKHLKKRKNEQADQGKEKKRSRAKDTE